MKPRLIEHLEAEGLKTDPLALMIPLESDEPGKIKPLPAGPAEFEAILRRLGKSARRWQTHAGSTNYFDRALRDFLPADEEV